MNAIDIALTVSIVLCSLVAGLVFAFAVVVMPGIKGLNDHDFLQAFQMMDRVIQNNQPIFVFVWLGSVVAVVTLGLLGIWHLDGINCTLAILALAIYLFGVQLPTATINIPLNNQLQTQSLDAMSESELREARKKFEPRWTLWNSIRAVLATVTTVLLIVLALRLR